MSVKPRARSIIRHCQRPGAYLAAMHVRHGLEFTLEPSSQRVRTEYALEAIRSGRLIARDLGLFGGDPQVWVYQPKPAAQLNNTNPHGESLAQTSHAFHSKSAEKEKTTMVDARKYFGVTFTTLADLADGPQQQAIVGVAEGQYGKLVLSFPDNSAVSLNATNSRALMKAYGSETDDWLGHVVELGVGTLEYQGKPQAAILVTPISPPSAEKTPAKPKPRGDGRDPDDDIPFN